jgi:predicted Zn-dependent peptidase
MLIFGRPIPPAELLAEIDAVDAAALADFARGMLEAGPPVLSAIGPIASLESYDTIAARFN